MEQHRYHIPVLLKESVDALLIDPKGVYVDATLGGGGHTREILSRLGDNGRLIVFDRDSEAIANAPNDHRVITVHNNFRFIWNFVRYYGYGEGVDGILADLGVSSHQFDTPERGFSFRFNTPVDMRMNTSGSKSAKEILNNYPEDELSRLFKVYGEVEQSRRAARLICAAREESPIESTGELNRVLQRCTPPNAEHKFLAKIYQALRIEVNGEMSSLEGFLSGALRSLKIGGRLSVITYHSLEDRMVKNFLREGAIVPEMESDIYGRRRSPFNIITRKPVLPEENEIAGNTRARSAKLRVGERVS